MTFWGHLSVDYNLVEYQLMTFWGRLSVRNIGLWPFWGHLSLWNNSLWPSEVVCLCGILDYDLFEVVCPCGIPAYDLPRSFVCAGYQLMTFWGRLSVRNIGLWPFWGHLSVDYNLFEVVCPCGITAYDLLRSFVCAGYRITIFLRSFCPFENTSSWPSEVICLCGISDYDLFWGRLSLWNTQLMTFWGHLSVDYNLFKVVCPCGIPAYDLLRSFVCAGYRITIFLRSFVLLEYQLMTFVSVRDTRSWPSEVVCLCGLPAHDLLRSFVCAGYRITTFFEVVCPCGIPSLWPSEVICLWIATFLRSSVLVEYQLMTFWGRLSFWNTSSWPFEVVCLCGIPDYNLFEVVCPFENTSSWPFEVVCLWGISDYDLFRSFVCAEYQIMTFWGRLITAYDLLRSFVCAKYRITTFWNTSSWPFEVLCLCGISDYDLFEVVCPFGIPAHDSEVVCLCGTLDLWPFEVVCLCGILHWWPLRSFVFAESLDCDLFKVICLCLDLSFIKKDHPSVCIRSFDLDFLQPLQGSAFAESAQDFFFVPIILLEGWSLVSPFSIWEFMMDCIPFPDLHDYGEGQRG
jgi:hypothetical protein